MFKPISRAGFQINGFPDAHRDKACDPVPTVGALDTAGIKTLCRKRTAALWQSIHLTDRGAEVNLQRVFACFQRAVDGIRPRTEHVVGFPDAVSVEENLTVNIESLEG